MCGSSSPTKSVNVGKVRVEGRLGLRFEVGLRLECVWAWSCSLTNDGCIAQERK